jgi:hypothetical protein
VLKEFPMHDWFNDWLIFTGFLYATTLVIGVMMEIRIRKARLPVPSRFELRHRYSQAFPGSLLGRYYIAFLIGAMLMLVAGLIAHKVGW